MGKKRRLGTGKKKKVRKPRVKRARTKPVKVADKPKEDRHHIIPRSRNGDSSHENICWVQKAHHSRYHALFVNMTPDEILEYLVNNFWNGQWHWLLQAIPAEEHHN